MAACCADASNSLWLNLPLAACAVVGVRWLSLQVDVRARADSLAAQRRRRSKGAMRQPLPAPLAPSGKPDSWWRQQVGSPVVERAWETLCGSIVQEARSPPPSRDTFACGGCDCPPEAAKMPAPYSVRGCISTGAGLLFRLT